MRNFLFATLVPLLACGSSPAAAPDPLEAGGTGSGGHHETSSAGASSGGASSGGNPAGGGIAGGAPSSSGGAAAAGATLADGGRGGASLGGAFPGGGTTAAGGAGGSGTSVIPIALADFAGAVLAAACNDGVAHCCTDDHASSYDQAQCQSTFQHELDNWQKPLMTDGVIYDGVQAAVCVALVKDALAHCQNTDSDAIAIACRSVVAGTVPAGGACTAEAQCVGAWGCDHGTCLGPPAEAPHLAVGDPCGYTCRTPGDDSSCDRTDTGGTCYESDGLRCEPGGGSCQQLADAHHPCDPLTLPCPMDKTCDPVTYECIPAGQFGDPCGDGSEVQCVAYSICDKFQTHTCLPQSPGGWPCSPDGPSNACRSGQCRGGTCVAFQEDIPTGCVP